MSVSNDKGERKKREEKKEEKRRHGAKQEGSSSVRQQNPGQVMLGPQTDQVEPVEPVEAAAAASHNHHTITSQVEGRSKRGGGFLGCGLVWSWMA